MNFITPQTCDEQDCCAGISAKCDVAYGTVQQSLQHDLYQLDYSAFGIEQEYITITYNCRRISWRCPSFDSEVFIQRYNGLSLQWENFAEVTGETEYFFQEGNPVGSYRVRQVLPTGVSIISDAVSVSGSDTWSDNRFLEGFCELSGKWVAGFAKFTYEGTQTSTNTDFTKIAWEIKTRSSTISQNSPYRSFNAGLELFNQQGNTFLGYVYFGSIDAIYAETSEDGWKMVVNTSHYNSSGGGTQTVWETDTLPFSTPCKNLFNCGASEVGLTVRSTTAADPYVMPPGGIYRTSGVPATITEAVIEFTDEFLY